MAQHRRFGRAGRAGGEDDQAGVAPVDHAVGTTDRAREQRREVRPLDRGGERPDPHRALDHQLGLFLKLHPVADVRRAGHHLLHQRPEVGDRRLPEEEVRRRLDAVEAVLHLLRLQPQVERRQHQADAVAREHQEDVLLEQRQARGDHVALAQADRQQLCRERRHRGVEALPRHGLAGRVLDDRDRSGSLARPVRDVVGEVRQQAVVQLAAALVLGGVLHLGGLLAHSADANSTPPSRSSTSTATGMPCRTLAVTMQ